MRDFRINKIFEGSTEIMHLFMAREMVDKHLQVAGAADRPRQAAVGEAGRAARGWRRSTRWWYPTRWLGWGLWPKYAGFGRLARHLRFVERSSRRLARASFHGMLVYQARLQNKQAFLFRLVDIANETFAMAASVARAQALVDEAAPEAARGRAAGGRLLPLGPPPRPRAVPRAVEQRRRGALPAAASRCSTGGHLWLEAGVVTAPSRAEPTATTAGDSGPRPRRRPDGGAAMAIRIRKLTLWRTEVAAPPGCAGDAPGPARRGGGRPAGRDGLPPPGRQVPGGRRGGTHRQPRGRPSPPTKAGLRPGRCADAAGARRQPAGPRQPHRARALADSHVNIAFLVAQVVGKRYSAVFGFENEADLDKAADRIRAAVVARPITPPRRRAGRPARTAARARGERLARGPPSVPRIVSRRTFGAARRTGPATWAGIPRCRSRRP